MVSEVLSEQGLDVEGLLSSANTEAIKKQLFSNTTRSVLPSLVLLTEVTASTDLPVCIPTCRAVEEGLCGVPTFQVNQGSLIWGQDKLNIVADMICGWQDHLQAKL